MTWLTKKPILALAPMADMTDSPFCRVCREVASGNFESEDEKSLFISSVNANYKTIHKPTEKGSLTVVRDYQPFVIFREMVSAEAIVRGNIKTLKMCEFKKQERPIVIQLFGGKPEVIVKAAKIVVEKYHPDGIDINMGCPVPKIAQKGNAGAALMKDPDRAVEIVKALKNANLGVPVTVKTRLGWAAEDEILTFAKLLEEAGVDGLSIHGRTKKQGYTGKANWEMIDKVKKLVKFPVVANGDINSAEDIQKCLEITGADGVMIGRAAIGNPWIFRFPSPTRGRLGGGLAIDETPPSPSPHRGGEISLREISKAVLRHAELHLERYGEEYGLKTFRKHLLVYFKGLSGVKEIKQELVKVTTIDDLKNVLKKLK
jgi:tRNA-dihydrouridine synthase B